MTAPWPTTGTIGSFRVSGKPFYCQDADTPAGFYRFLAPRDDEPIGSFANELGHPLVHSESAVSVEDRLAELFR